MWIARLVPMVLLLCGCAAPACADTRFDVGLLLASTRATDETPILQFDRGTTSQAANRVHNVVASGWFVLRF